MLRFAPCSILLALLFVPMAFAKEGTPQERGAVVRGKLGEPNSIDALKFEGDLSIGGLWAGTVSFEARPHTFVRESVWRVVEKFFIDYKGVEKHLTLRYMLSPDLALRSGGADVNVEGTKIATVFTPSKKGFQFFRTTTKPDGKSSTESFELAAPPKATSGTPALLLLARALSAKFSDDHQLPWFPLTDVVLGQTPEGTADRHLTLSPLPKDQRMQVGWGFLGTDGKTSWSIHLSSDRRRLVRFDGPAFKIVPKGQGGERIVLSEEKPAKTWQQAFLKFGYGYHMAREKLLEEAFHWESMLEYESTVTKSWAGPKDLAKFRDAWVAEFIRQSLRRTRAATEQLLNMTLASGKVTKESGDQVVFAAHKNFGGGTQRTYTLKKVDGIWFIAHVKF